MGRGGQAPPAQSYPQHGGRGGNAGLGRAHRRLSATSLVRDGRVGCARVIAAKLASGGDPPCRVPSAPASTASLKRNMMPQTSALLTVMIAAARKAGRPLGRDFGEVENLQVSRKGP